LAPACVDAIILMELGEIIFNVFDVFTLIPPEFLKENFDCH